MSDMGLQSSHLNLPEIMPLDGDSSNISQSLSAFVGLKPVKLLRAAKLDNDGRSITLLGSM